MRYVLETTFRGTDYAGWQIQPNAPSIQEELIKALTTLLREETYCVGAGRTDAGVHAHQLFAHFEHDGELPKRFLQSLNGLLPKDIAVHGLFKPVEPDFHVRFAAVSRAYTYTVVLRKDPLLREQAWWVRPNLDVERMNEAAALLMQYEEFGSFCKSNAQNEHNRCRMDHAYWEVLPDRWCFQIQANRFLRGMVRAIVGTLIWVGSEKISVEDFRTVIEAQDRRAAGPAAPPEGLSLVKVAYPEGSLMRITQ